MNSVEFDALLRRSLQDGEFSGSERRAVMQMLSDHPPGDHQLAYLRNRVFQIAKEHVESPGEQRVVDWIEDVVKLLIPRETEDEDRADAYFSPDDDCPSEIRQLIRRANKSLDVCVFTITDDRISSALLDAHRRGRNLRIITDDEKSEDTGSDVDELAAHGIQVRMDRSSHHMHHKYAVFDDEILLTGSYNWTRSAALKNQENFIVTTNRRLVSRFARSFEKLWRDLG